MNKILNLYIDDSGTRHPDRDAGGWAAAHGRDWFALGGILIRDEDEEVLRAAHRAFCDKWHITTPLHSAEIRGRSGNFNWLAQVRQSTFDLFMNELSNLLLGLPVMGHACVIDRPGYNRRYAGVYGANRWLLCKTAFSVVVERAAKYALKEGRRLRIYAERADPLSDKRGKEYFLSLKNEGMPFAGGGAEAYRPLTGADFQSVLYDFKTKWKTSPPMQIADLYLWPMCIGGYDQGNRPYRLLRECRKLIDDHLEAGEATHLGIKYSCWDLVSAQTQQSPIGSLPGFVQPPQG